MTELQIILIVCALVFVGSLYWWGKKSKNEPIQRAYRTETLPAQTPEEEEYEVTPIKRADSFQASAAPSLAQSAKEGMLPRDAAAAFDPRVNSVANEAPSLVETQLSAPALAVTNNHHSASQTTAPLLAEEDALSARMNESTAHEALSMAQSFSANQAAASAETAQSQLFALLVLSASAKFTRKQLHVAMEASRLNFHHDGTYVKQDANGNIIFRIANVVEPGYFPQLDEVNFESPGVALVLELPNAITPYRAMDEFITVARKVSQNLGAKLYDAQRHLIKESDLKAMREYAQSLTF